MEIDCRWSDRVTVPKIVDCAVDWSLTSTCWWSRGLAHPSLVQLQGSWFAACSFEPHYVGFQWDFLRLLRWRLPWNQRWSWWEPLDWPQTRTMGCHGASPCASTEASLIINFCTVFFFHPQKSDRTRPESETWESQPRQYMASVEMGLGSWQSCFIHPLESPTTHRWESAALAEQGRVSIQQILFSCCDGTSMPTLIKLERHQFGRFCIIQPGMIWDDILALIQQLWDYHIAQLPKPSMSRMWINVSRKPTLSCLIEVWGWWGPCSMMVGTMQVCLGMLSTQTSLLDFMPFPKSPKTKASPWEFGCHHQVALVKVAREGWRQVLPLDSSFMVMQIPQVPRVAFASQALAILIGSSMPLWIWSRMASPFSNLTG